MHRCEDHAWLHKVIWIWRVERPEGAPRWAARLHRHRYDPETERWEGQPVEYTRYADTFLAIVSRAERLAKREQLVSPDVDILIIKPDPDAPALRRDEARALL